MINVSWDDAKEYAAWLSKKSGRPYRLLSEAEWEYAARAGTTGSRYWGDREDDACAYASVYDAQGKKIFDFAKTKGIDWPSFACDDGYSATAPVGLFQPNRFGLYDMLGNVWEWVQDCFHASYEGAPKDGSAWQEEPQCRRVVRGGSWFVRPDFLRSAYRGWLDPDYRGNFLGFRLAQDLQ